VVEGLFSQTFRISGTIQAQINEKYNRYLERNFLRAEKRKDKCIKIAGKVESRLEILDLTEGPRCFRNLSYSLGFGIQLTHRLE
jgi:hypothetical protein